MEIKIDSKTKWKIWKIVALAGIIIIILAYIRNWLF